VNQSIRRAFLLQRRQGLRGASWYQPEHKMPNWAQLGS
jgi:hypothetical protein